MIDLGPLCIWDSCVLGLLLTVDTGASLTLLLALGPSSWYWVAFHSLNTRGGA